ncbi:TPA: hypothetical protein ACGGLL_000667 [Escherichia coli]
MKPIRRCGTSCATIGVATAVIAVLMLLTAPKLHRMTQDDAADKAAKAAVA